MPRYAQDMPEICLRSTWDMPKIRQRNAWDRGLYFFLPKISFFSKNPIFRIWVFFKNAMQCSFYWKEWVFFLITPCLLQKPLVFGKIYILIILKMCFQHFARYVWPIGGKKLGNARNFNKAKSGVSQIHLWQLLHFIIVRCDYCLQPSLSYPRFLQTDQKRDFLFYRID